MSAPASSTEQQPPKRKDARKGRKRVKRESDRGDYWKDRRLIKRTAECNAAGIPHTRYMRLTTATASIISKDADEREDRQRTNNKNDVAELLNAAQQKDDNRALGIKTAENK